TLREYNLSCLAPLVFNDQGQSHERRIQSGRATGRGPGELIRIPETTSAAFFIQRETFRDIGGFDPVLFDFVGSTEDREFFLRMRSKGVDLYMDPYLTIYHSEEQKGGCRLRDRDYWTNRRNFMKGWIYGSQKRTRGKFDLSERWHVWRTCFFNKKVFSKGVKNIWRHFKCYRKAKKEVCREFPGICDQPSSFVS
ncbi:MAG: hypothetical protein R3275_13710, partial [Saprospiraceae bacterium]|nr:hypothetical protein [Saprospiraceae bacterium]